MKVSVSFMAMASVTRVLEVEIPSDTPEDSIRKVAEAKAAQKMAQNEDVVNESGEWAVSFVERPSISVDNTKPLVFPLSAPDDLLDQFKGIVPE